MMKIDVEKKFVKNGKDEEHIVIEKKRKRGTCKNINSTKLDDWIVALQYPGDIFKHHGGHFHFVINAIDLTLNPDAFTVSIGYTIDNKKQFSTWLRRAPDAGFVDRDGTIEKCSHPLRPCLIKSFAKQSNKIIPRKKEGRKGFRKGNKLRKKENKNDDVIFDSDFVKND